MNTITCEQFRDALAASGFTLAGTARNGLTRWRWPGDDDLRGQSFTLPPDPQPGEEKTADWQLLVDDALHALTHVAVRGAQARAVLDALGVPVEG